MQCSICEKKFDPADKKDVLPFCSLRCKNIDLNRWLEEGYGLPCEDESQNNNDTEI